MHETAAAVKYFRVVDVVVRSTLRLETSEWLPLDRVVANR